METNLLLTLGHNSSAIAIRDGNVVGYEEERLSRVKSSSAFPNNALKEIEKWMPLDPGTIFVSHWFDSFEWQNQARASNSRLRKYVDIDWLDGMVDLGWKIRTLSDSLTHHDAHAHSAATFAAQHLTPGKLSKLEKQGFHVIVCDGFGNNQEVLSVYESKDCLAHSPSNLKLIHRVRGYHKSLGLLYQYATDFCGMRMNQDEYKFLGYESHITEVGLIATIADLTTFARRTAEFMFADGFKDSTVKSDPAYINTTALDDAKAYFTGMFETAMFTSRITDPTVFQKRVVIGFFIQTLLEHYYSKIIHRFNITNVICAGGVHFNVKLNHHVLSTVPGQVSIVPLAGDQGCAIGLYTAEGNHFPFHGLLWGRRDLGVNTNCDCQGVHVFDKRQDYVEFVAKALKEDKIVNTVTGSMEFGPRALCNTSTLALPSSQNVAAINALNGRDTVMPFAGVMLDKNLPFFHDHAQYNRVIGSHYYMITTLDYALNPNDRTAYRGIMHKYPIEDMYSGRPQVVRQKDLDMPIVGIANAMFPQWKAIINTSLNVHGVPIVFSVQDALNDYQYNVEQARALNLKTPILVIGNFTTHPQPVGAD